MGAVSTENLPKPSQCKKAFHEITLPQTGTAAVPATLIFKTLFNI